MALFIVILHLRIFLLRRGFFLNIDVPFILILNILSGSSFTSHHCWFLEGGARLLWIDS
jgi:hypothetical protein